MSKNELESAIEVGWQRNGEINSKRIPRNLIESPLGIEWELGLNELNVGWIPANSKIQIRITTSFSNNRSDICDQTNCFEPMRF